MKTLCLIPIYNHTKNITKILKQFEKEIFPKIQKLGAVNPEIKFPCNDYVFVGTNQELKAPQKGEGIISSLKNSGTVPEIVIVCDGSNAINPLYVVEIFKELTSDTSISCVMANRVGNKAINKFRYLIERFEVFVIKKYHNHLSDIPDGQCGLWGYRHGILLGGKEIKITAIGYEIELDLLSEVLENELNYSFIEIILLPRSQSKSPSKFTYQDNIQKMLFFINKYRKLKSRLCNFFKDFGLTDEFKTLIKEVPIEKWDNYKKDILSIKKR